MNGTNRFKNVERLIVIYRGNRLQRHRAKVAETNLFRLLRRSYNDRTGETTFIFGGLGENVFDNCIQYAHRSVHTMPTVWKKIMKNNGFIVVLRLYEIKILLMDHGFRF